MACLQVFIRRLGRRGQSPGDAGAVRCAETVLERPDGQTPVRHLPSPANTMRCGRSVWPVAVPSLALEKRDPCRDRSRRQAPGPCCGGTTSRSSSAKASGGRRHLARSRFRKCGHLSISSGRRTGDSVSVVMDNCSPGCILSTTSTPSIDGRSSEFYILPKDSRPAQRVLLDVTPVPRDLAPFDWVARRPARDCGPSRCEYREAGTCGSQTRNRAAVNRSPPPTPTRPTRRCRRMVCESPMPPTKWISTSCLITPSAPSRPHHAGDGAQRVGPCLVTGGRSVRLCHRPLRPVGDSHAQPGRPNGNAPS